MHFKKAEFNFKRGKINLVMPAEFNFSTAEGRINLIDLVK